ncbi:MAG TPA: SH3 domain-containing protein, partial [Dehalococcoidia bacterium]|nr:SH3 domain-containing protein [Dehalococcoidia bacterium]
PADLSATPADEAAAPSSEAETAPDETSPAEVPPAPASAPVPVTATAVTTAYLRTQPSNDALITRSLPAGSAVSVLACSAGCSWLLVQTADGSQAWSASVWYSIRGSTAGLAAR